MLGVIRAREEKKQQARTRGKEVESSIGWTGKCQFSIVFLPKRRPQKPSRNTCCIPTMSKALCGSLRIPKWSSDTGEKTVISIRV